MIRRCVESDFTQIRTVVNDGALAYQGVIPADCWTKPFMSRQKLQHEMSEGVVFWGFEEEGLLIGVMGIQRVQDVTLIRHAYVLTRRQKKGLGARLLTHLRSMATTPVLIGTWANATWAIRFYQNPGFRLVSTDQKNLLLKKYWNVPETAD